ncbi:hypothetical protein EVAR_12366_1 [Eumeta japonica]|uniref:Uncharacterized protein n=1 Tax=Eumeta variegata TaxID=151549 RepID=A0A4C1X323_EUMVA|nr:hypothetical protein EVAR_12366_1 [Eumeta japonica]
MLTPQQKQARVKCCCYFLDLCGKKPWTNIRILLKTESGFIFMTSRRVEAIFRICIALGPFFDAAKVFRPRTGKRALGPAPSPRAVLKAQTYRINASTFTYSRPGRGGGRRASVHVYLKQHPA